MGSEMCIRDSLPLALTEHPESVGAIGREHLAEALRPRLDIDRRLGRDQAFLGDDGEDRRTGLRVLGQRLAYEHGAAPGLLQGLLDLLGLEDLEHVADLDVGEAVEGDAALLAVLDLGDVVLEAAQ